MLSLDDSLIKEYINKEDYQYYQPMVDLIHQELHNQPTTMPGRDYLGWLDIDQMIDEKEFKLIEKLGPQIRENYDALVVIGIGGSYLGAKSIIELLSPYFDRQGVEIIFVGQNMSTAYLTDVYNHLVNKHFCINVISKSGTTLEPALSFRLFKSLLMQQDPENYNKHIIATTDANKGALLSQAKENGWTTLVVPDNVGGRFSVLTPVGLLPISVAGINLRELIAGAKQASIDYSNSDLNTNSAYRYALNRQILHRQGKDIEMLVGYEPNLVYLCEWWKQLFAESEGKNNQGILPIGAIFTTDLHSIGQYIQEGKRNLFETVIKVKEFWVSIPIVEEEGNLDELNYLVGKDIQFCNNCALEATMQAHVSGGVPNMLIEIDQLDAYHVGYLIYFFELAVSMSGRLNGINPFNQPGVEEYKQRMFKLLGKE